MSSYARVHVWRQSRDLTLTSLSKRNAFRWKWTHTNASTLQLQEKGDTGLAEWTLHIILRCLAGLYEHLLPALPLLHHSTLYQPVRLPSYPPKSLRTHMHPAAAPSRPTRSGCCSFSAGLESGKAKFADSVVHRQCLCAWQGGSFQQCFAPREKEMSPLCTGERLPSCQVSFLQPTPENRKFRFLSRDWVDKHTHGLPADVAKAASLCHCSGQGPSHAKRQCFPLSAPELRWVGPWFLRTEGKHP